MIRQRLRPFVLLTVLLLVTLVISGLGLWLRSAKRQYALNRQLIAALIHHDDQKALTLVEAGADPNACYKPSSAPSLLKLVKQVLHPSLASNSPTAFMIACGAPWNNSDYSTVAAQRIAL